MIRRFLSKSRSRVFGDSDVAVQAELISNEPKESVFEDPRDVMTRSMSQERDWVEGPRLDDHEPTPPPPPTMPSSLASLQAASLRPPTPNQGTLSRRSPSPVPDSAIAPIELDYRERARSRSRSRSKTPGPPGQEEGRGRKLFRSKPKKMKRSDTLPAVSREYSDDGSRAKTPIFERFSSVFRSKTPGPEDQSDRFSWWKPGKKVDEDSVKFNENPLFKELEGASVAETDTTTETEKDTKVEPPKSPKKMSLKKKLLNKKEKPKRPPPPHVDESMQTSDIKMEQSGSDNLDDVQKFGTDSGIGSDADVVKTPPPRPPAPHEKDSITDVPEVKDTVEHEAPPPRPPPPRYKRFLRQFSFGKNGEKKNNGKNKEQPGEEEIASDDATSPSDDVTTPKNDDVMCRSADSGIESVDKSPMEETAKLVNQETAVLHQPRIAERTSIQHTSGASGPERNQVVVPIQLANGTHQFFDWQQRERSAERAVRERSTRSMSKPPVPPDARSSKRETQLLSPTETEEETRGKWKQALRDADPFGSIGRRNDLPARSHSVAAERYRDNLDDVEKPMVLDQAQRALRATTPGAISVGGVSTGTNGTMKRRTNYGSYRMLDNDNYHSDMDDLCDPDFYLNYASPRLQAPKSEQLPRKQYRPLETHNEFDDLSERSQPAASCMDVSKSSNPDDWRQRNCRSVAAAPTSGKSYIEKKNSPFFRDRKLFSNEGYDAVQQASNPDDWLTTKLRKLKSKRDMDPDIVRRRTQEKMLLEELKSSAAERETHDREAEARAADALEAYKREEERLKNTYSPFDEGARSRGRGVRGKPPTPPPRERSRSPPTETPSRMSTLNSQALDTYKQEPQHNRPQNLQQQQPLQQNGFHSAKETNVDEDFSDFSHLTNILKNNNASSTPLPQRDHPLPRPASRQQNQQQNSYGAASEYQTYNRGETPTFPRGETPSYYGTQDRYETFGRAVTPSGQYISGQERVAAAIARAETPTRQFSTQPRSDSRIDRRNSQLNDRSPSTLGRAETPQFPLKRNETPLPYHPLLYSHSTQSRPDLRDREARESMTMNHRSASPRSQYYGSRRSSSTSVDPGEIIHHHPVFVKDTSKYWYKPAISREQAINILRDQPPGTFVVRDSNSFPGAFGLALKVATPPPGVQAGDGTELVRHFLIEPSPKGVKLKGCNNEPVFGSLSALVYQHSITPLALPAKLILPEYDPATSAEHVSAKQMLLEQGAACNVAYIGTVDCESLTGPACVKRCVARLFDDLTLGYLTPVSVHFKVSSQGVTLTDNTRKLFFRRHYPVHSVIYAGSDPDDRRWDNTIVTGYTQGCLRAATIFAVVARKVNTLENQCHVFAEFEPEQPAHAVLNFINKVLLDPSRRN